MDNRPTDRPVKVEVAKVGVLGALPLSYTGLVMNGWMVGWGRGWGWGAAGRAGI